MSAREDVVAAAEALRLQLPRLRRRWPQERWTQVQTEFLAWLSTFERCRHPEEWLAAWKALVALTTRHQLLDFIESPPMYARTLPDVADPLTGPERTHDEGDPRRPPRSVGELTARLRRLLVPMSGARASPLEAYPEARVEGDVFEQRVFRLEVIVRAEPTPRANHKATLPRSREEPVELDVVLHLPRDGALTHRSPLDHPLRVPQGRDSNRVSFELFAVRPGHHKVGVRFLQSGITRAELTVLVHVLAAHEPTSPRAVSTAVHAALHVGSGRVPPGLVLTVEPLGSANGSRFLFVSLNDHAARRHVPAHHELVEDSQQSLVALCLRMEGELALRQTEARENRLRGIGAELAAKMLPHPIQQELASDRHEKGTALHIESRAMWLPWELLFVGSPARGRFLGEWFAVTRWHGHAQLRGDLDGTRAVLVAPRSPGLRVDAERHALERLTGAPVEELHTLHTLQERLHRDPPMGFLHFACHGTAAPVPSPSGGTSPHRDVVVPSPGAPGHPPPPHPRGVLLLEDEEPLQTSDVPRTPHSAPAPLKGAFVFLNACQAGLPGSSPWGHEGWVNTFFEAGAVAMVAPSWMISDAAAGRFSQTLYHRLAAGETLGRAAWWAREEIREQGSADHLGYAVYAYPEARWCPPPSPDGTERP